MKFPYWLPVYGDASYRGPCPVEDVEQIKFFGSLRIEWPQYSRIAIHPKIEGKRTPQQVAKERKMGGMNTGASDIIIPGCPALVIEMKRRDHTKSKWQAGQIDYLEASKNAGAMVCVALGAEAAIQAVEEWHSQKNRP